MSENNDRRFIPLEPDEKHRIVPMLDIKYTPADDLVVIDGVKFAGNFFRRISKAHIGGVMQVTEIKDGYVDMLYLGHGRRIARKAVKK